MLIAIEGIDAAGKSSVAEALAKNLHGNVISFPNDKGYTGPAIRMYLKGMWGIYPQEAKDNLVRPNDCKHLGALALQCLQVANRMEVMPQLAEAAGSSQKNIVLARYWQSGWVYGQFDGLKEKFLRGVHSSMVQADLNILLCLQPEEAMRRREVRDGKKPPEIYEGKLENLRKAADLYMSLWLGGRNGWDIVDANHSLDRVIGDCWTLVLTYLKSHFREQWLKLQPVK